jgi:hypothetical protein
MKLGSLLLVLTTNVVTVLAQICVGVQAFI